MKIIEPIKNDLKKWNNQDYKKKCYDIGLIIRFGIFIGVIFYAINAGYLDYVDSVAENIINEEEFYENLTDSERTQWRVMTIGFVGGVLLLPVIILNYVSEWIGMGLMYLVYVYHQRRQKERNE